MSPSRPPLELRICPLWEVSHHLTWATEVVSIIQHDRAEDLPPWELVPARVLRLQFEDLVPAELHLRHVSADRGPQEHHVRELIAFAHGIPEGARVLVHCEAGVSRSAAAAWILLCAKYPETSPDHWLDLVLRLRPEARPNGVLVAHADRVLQQNGRLLEVLRKLHEGQGWFWIDPPGGTM